MRATTWVLAGLSFVAGVIVIASVILDLDADPGAGGVRSFEILGSLLLAGIGMWSLLTSIWFMRRRHLGSAIAVGRVAGVLLFLVLIGILLGPLESALRSVHPLVLLVAPFAAMAGVWAGYTFLYKPACRGAFLPNEEHDDDARRVAGSRKAVDLGQLRTVHEPTEELFRQLRRRIVMLGVPLCLAAVVTGWFSGESPMSDPATDIPILLLVVAILVTTLYGTYRRQRQRLATLRIEFGDEGIARTQSGLAAIAIRFVEMAAILELPAKGLMIIGRGAGIRLFVPREISDFDELKERLARVAPIAHAKARRFAWLVPIAWIVSVVACMGLAFWSTDRTVATVTSSILIIVLATSVPLMVRSPLIDQTIKRRLWIVVFPILSLGMRLWYLWFPPS